MAESNDGKTGESGFRVTDRRGSNRDDSARADASPNVTDTSKGASVPHPPIDFTTFILSLASTAMIQMGAAPHPETGQASPEPELARETIDLLGMLREKTRGNLTDEESKFFDALLYDLRVHFVEMTSRHRP